MFSQKEFELPEMNSNNQDSLKKNHFRNWLRKAILADESLEIETVPLMVTR